MTSGKYHIKQIYYQIALYYKITTWLSFYLISCLQKETKKISIIVTKIPRFVKNLKHDLGQDHTSEGSHISKYAEDINTHIVLEL